MKKFVLPALVAAALASAASADITLNFGSQSFAGFEGNNFPTITGVTGTLTGFSVSFVFAPDQDAIDNGSWGSDFAVIINNQAWGGYDLAPVVAHWSFNGFGSADPGPYSDTRSDIPGAIASPTTLDVTVGNGWSDSGPVQYNDMVVTLFGVVPTPSAAALLGLGGLVSTRRRR